MFSLGILHGWPHMKPSYDCINFGRGVMKSHSLTDLLFLHTYSMAQTKPKISMGPLIVFSVGYMSLCSYRIYVVVIVIVGSCIYFVGPMLTSYESTHTSNHLHSFYLDNEVVFHLLSWLCTGTSKGKSCFQEVEQGALCHWDRPERFVSSLIIWSPFWSTYI